MTITPTKHRRAWSEGNARKLAQLSASRVVKCLRAVLCGDPHVRALGQVVVRTRFGSVNRVNFSEKRVRDLVAGWADQAVEIVECDPTLADTTAFCEAYGYPLEDSANTIVVVGKAQLPRFVACVLLATTRLDVNQVVRRRLEVKKASFAGADQTVELTGMAVGGVTPLGLPPDLPVWIDHRVMARERIVLGGGSRNCKVIGPPSLLLRLGDGVEIVEGLAMS